MLLLPLERESDQYRAPPTCRVGAATRYVQYFSFHPFSIAVGLFFPPALSSFKVEVRTRRLPPPPPPPSLQAHGHSTVAQRAETAVATIEL